MRIGIEGRAAAGIALAAMVALIGGCGGGNDPVEPVADPPAAAITYKVFAGFPPTVRSIEIDESGQARTEAVYRESPDDESTDTFTVSEQDLDEIRGYLAAADLGTLEDSSDDCTDCVFAQIRYGDGEVRTGSTSAPEEDAELPEELRAALELLSELLPPAEQPPPNGSDG